MSDIQFEWDSAKAEANLRKHGVSFEEAETVFSDDLALLIDDPDHSDEEECFVLLGVSVAPRILAVVHAYRSAPELIRIISARKATKSERTTYVKRP
ncbi:MAG: BrnT family toxin [Acidobacteria bacterium]|nr:BrnT family toxin [Acidobacteriota bacterium]